MLLSKADAKLQNLFVSAKTFLKFFSFFFSASDFQGTFERSSHFNKKPHYECNEVLKERRRPTLPPVAVPSALMGLTSLFGMVRGEPHCCNHLKLFQYISTV